MKINQLSVLFCAMLLIGAFVSCRNDEMQEAITESAEGMVFRLQKAAFSISCIFCQLQYGSSHGGVPDPETF